MLSNSLRNPLFILFGVAMMMGCSDDADMGNDTAKNILPQLYINVESEIPNEPKIPALLRVEIMNSVQYEGVIGIELRGSSSQRLFPKLSYGIETWDENHNDINVSLLGMPAEQDWILYGPYADRSLLRNVIIYQLANELSQYAPRTEIVELILNGEYRGVYIFMEKIKRSKYRVDINKLNNSENDGEDLTGGYILKIDKTTGDNEINGWEGDFSYTQELGWRSKYDHLGRELIVAPHGPKMSSETYFLYEYPKNDDITNTQKEYIQNYINDFENSLVLNNDYKQYINLNSFVDYFLLAELSANPDAYRLSTFMYKDKNSPLSMGPIWDYNLAFGTDGRSRTDQWIYQYNNYYPNDLWLVHFWWPALIADPAFRTEVKSRWTELKQSIFHTSYFNGLIDQYSSYMKAEDAISRNFATWDVLGVEVPFAAPQGTTYDDELNYLRTWIAQRLSWMDSEIMQW